MRGEREEYPFVMDAAGLMLVLSRTLDPSQREGAEKQLEEVGTCGPIYSGTSSTERMGARVCVTLYGCVECLYVCTYVSVCNTMYIAVMNVAV